MDRNSVLKGKKAAGKILFQAFAILLGLQKTAEPYL